MAQHVPLLSFADAKWVPWAIWALGPLAMIGTLAAYVRFFRERVIVYYPAPGARSRTIRIPVLGVISDRGLVSYLDDPDAHVVVLSPKPGARLHTPFHIHGMANTFEKNVVVELLDQNTGLWETIEITIADGPIGELSPFVAEVDVAEGQQVLRVGEPSPRDGSFQGVELPITVVSP